jgi:hypothetical protein
LLVVALLAGCAARADAATYCVGTRAADCVAKESAAQAFAAARADSDRDTIVLGRLNDVGPFADAEGRPVRVVGAGASATRLRAGASGPALRLHDEGSSAGELRLEGAGTTPALQVDAGAALRSAMVSGRVLVRGGAAELSSVALTGDGPLLEVNCDAASASVGLAHVTVAGAGSEGVTARCSTASRSVALALENSTVWGFARPFGLGAGAKLSAAYSNYAGATGRTNRAVDPRFEGRRDVRLRPDSPLVDRGRPGPLSGSESHEDALGFVRAVDGNRDGAPRRDVGALELQPAPPASPPGNMLSNPGAEAGTPADDDASSPAPPDWSRTGGFTFVRYGTVAGLFPFPSRRVAQALDAGDAFFAGGPGRNGSATQVADLAGRRSGDRPRPGDDLAVRAPGRLSGQQRRRDRRGRVPRPGWRVAWVRADRPGAIRRARRGDHARPALGLRPDPAADPLGGGHPALDSRVGKLRRRLLRRDLARAAHGRRAAAPAAGARRPAASLLRRHRDLGRAAIDRRRRVWVRLACASRTVGRCRGVLTITARTGARSERRVGRGRFDLRRGRAAAVAVPVRRATARRLRSRGRLRGHVHAASRDLQGLTRTSTAPVRLARGTFVRGRG